MSDKQRPLASTITHVTFFGHFYAKIFVYTRIDCLNLMKKSQLAFILMIPSNCGHRGTMYLSRLQPYGTYHHNKGRFMCKAFP